LRGVQHREEKAGLGHNESEKVRKITDQSSNVRKRIIGETEGKEEEKRGNRLKIFEDRR
jgi:hypothetical protein